MIKKLKDPEILKKKPNLILKPNHYHYRSPGRVWVGEKRGIAIRDDKTNWYK